MQISTVLMVVVYICTVITFPVVLLAVMYGPFKEPQEAIRILFRVAYTDPWIVGLVLIQLAGLFTVRKPKKKDTF